MKRLLLWLTLSRAERRGIRTLYELSCSCAVITPEDGERWNEAQDVIGRLLGERRDADSTEKP